MLHPRPAVRPATAADLDEIAEIYAHYVTTTEITFDEVPLTASAWRQKIDDLSARDLPFLVAHDTGDGSDQPPDGERGHVIGFAYAGPWRPKPAYRCTVEDTIYLAPDRTGRGTGSALLSALIEYCTRAGMRQMVAVIADTGNAASIALHRRLGFSDAGRLAGVGHKHGRWIDTILMQRQLTDGLAGGRPAGRDDRT